MPAYPNGRVPSAMLREVAPGVLLAGPTAVSWNAMVLVARERYGWAFAPAPGEGSGYRSLAMQQLYLDAAAGNRAAQERVGLSASSTASLAPVGASSHGWGTAIDALFGGSDRPSPGQLQLAARYGFKLTIRGDPNHLGHDGIARDVRDNDRVAIIARYLNGRELPGKRTAAQEDGVRGKFYWTRIQEAGHADRLYPTPPYIIDGDPDRKDGKPSRTRLLETHYWDVIVRG